VDNLNGIFDVLERGTGSGSGRKLKQKVKGQANDVFLVGARAKSYDFSVLVRKFLLSIKATLVH